MMHRRYLAVIVVLPSVLLSACAGPIPKIDAEFKHVLWVNCLAYSPDGRFLAAGSRGISQKAGEYWEGKVVIWDVETQKQAAVLPQTQWVRSLAFCPSRKLLAVGSGSLNTHPNLQYHGFKKKPGEIRIYEVPTWKEVAQWHDNDVVLAVAFAPDGNALVSSSMAGRPFTVPSSAGRVTLWEVPTWKKKTEIPGIDSGGPSVVFHPKVGVLVVGDIDKSSGGNGRVKVFAPGEWKNQREFSVQRDAPGELTFSPTGEILSVAYQGEGPFVLWDFKTGKDIRSVAFKEALMAASGTVAFSADGTFLAATQKAAQPAGEKKQHWIKIWDLKKDKLHAQWFWPTKGDPVTCLAFSPNSQSLAAGSMEGEIKTFRVPD